MGRKACLFVVVLFVGTTCGCDQKWAEKWKNNKTAQPDPNAVAMKVEPIKSLDERKLNGPVLMYYDNGQLKAERNYKNSKLDGTYRMYYDNGQLKVEGSYKDDKMEGAFRYYAPNGQTLTEEIYKDNIPISRMILNK